MKRTVLLALLLAHASLAPALADGALRGPRIEERSVAQLQADQAAGRLSSEELTRFYLARIAALDQGGPGVNSVIELNPDALAEAVRRPAVPSLVVKSDGGRAAGEPLSPAARWFLHRPASTSCA